MTATRSEFRYLAPAACLAGLLVWLGLALAAEPAGKKYAVLVGVKEYDHAKLKPLNYAEADVTELRDVLAKAGYEVILLTTAEGQKDPAHDPTLARIQKALAQVLDKCKRYDTVLVALSGHGLQFEDQDDAYYCPRDAKPLPEKTATLLSLKGVYKQLDDSGAGVKLMLVDACRDDPRAKGAKGITADSAPRPPRGVAALFSCSAGEQSFESDKVKHGVFFKYVLKGLEGAAKNDRREVTWDRLQEYVREQVPDAVQQLVGAGVHQTPNLNSTSVSGKPPVLLTLDVIEAVVRPASAEAPFDAEKAKEVQRQWAKYLRKNVVDQVDLGDDVKMELVLVPPGKFQMGSPANEEGRYDDEHQHPVEISKPFYIGKFTVTRGQFRRFVTDDEYRTEAEKDGKGGWGFDADKKDFVGRDTKYNWKDPGYAQTDEHPVVNVTWNDAKAFCAWLSRKTGRRFRLPTDAEWEYSCRAGTTTRFYAGDRDEDLRRVANIADTSLKAKWDYSTWGDHKKKLDDWYAKDVWDDSHAFTAPVGSFRPNAFGLYDMHGNVWQWCQDVYDKDYYKSSPERDPQGPGASAGSLRVRRGGSFCNVPRVCRAADRGGYVPACRGCFLGFRVVCVR